MASAGQAQVGQAITYTYQVSNTGTLLLDRVSASDDKLGTVTLGQTTLAPGERTTGYLTYTVIAADLPGPLVNSVVVSGAVSGTLSAGLVVTTTAEATVQLPGFTIYLPALYRGDSAVFQKEQLGKSIFFDENLSINRNQSCASCHGPEAGWTGPQSDINAHGAVYEGSIADRFGDRKPPSAAYATQSPIFQLDENGQFVGGNFWDGRATGERLGNPAADQALGPFLNPVEQALADSSCVVHRVCTASYPVAFEDVWGAAACDIVWPSDVETLCATEGVTLTLSAGDRVRAGTAFDNIALSIAAFEASAEVNAFTSKFDYVLQGTVQLTQEEQWGYTLFQTTGKCHKCHTDSGQQPLFTDFTFANLGIPQHPENPAGVAPAFVDPGLGGFLENAGYPQEVYEAEWGKHKTPTLRNLDLRPDAGFIKAYGHNGYFKTLKGIVHFYNTRDIKSVCPGPFTEAQALAADCWPPPEVPVNLNTQEMGDLGLTAEEEDAIVAFMKTLSDGYQP
jgi:cytochrome c peroxidase